MALKKLKAILRSVKLAVVLIIILVLASLAGILIPQTDYQNVFYEKFGAIGYFLGFLGLFNVFRSPLFIVTSLLLFINILFCTISRSGKLAILRNENEFNGDPEFYDAGGKGAVVNLSGSDDYLTGRLIKIFAIFRYRARVSEYGDSILFNGVKNRISAFGSLIVHTSLLILLLGIFTGAFWGFSNQRFIVAEGETESVGFGTGVSVRLISFKDTYWADGTPKEYRSTVEILDENQIVLTQSVTVNHPLRYKGIKFYQSFFGPSAVLTISDTEGNLLNTKNIPLADSVTEGSFSRPVARFELSESGYSMAIISAAVNGHDPAISENELGVEFYDENGNGVSWIKLIKNRPSEIGGLVFTYLGKSRYSGFIASKKPGNIIIWASALLFLSGLAMVFYFPFRKLHAALVKVNDADYRLYIKLIAQNNFGGKEELQKIVEGLRKLTENSQDEY